MKQDTFLQKILKIGAIAITLWSSQSFAQYFEIYNSTKSGGPSNHHNTGCFIYQRGEDINVGGIGSEQFATGEFWATGDAVACRAACANWNEPFNKPGGFSNKWWDYRDLFTHSNVPNYWNGGKLETMYQCRTHLLAFSNYWDKSESIRCSYRVDQSPQCNLSYTQYPYPKPTCSMTVNPLKGIAGKTNFNVSSWNATKEQYCRMNYKSGDSAIIGCNGSNFDLKTYTRGSHNVNLKVYGVTNSFINNGVNVSHLTTCTKTIAVHDPASCSLTYSGPSTLSISANTAFTLTSKSNTNLADVNNCIYEKKLLKSVLYTDNNYPCASTSVSATARQVGSNPGYYSYNFTVIGKGGDKALCSKIITLVK